MTKVSRKQEGERKVADGSDMGNMCHNSDMGDMDDYHRCYYNNLVLHTAFGSRPRCSTSLAWLGRPTRAAVCQLILIRKPQKGIYCIKENFFFVNTEKKAHTHRYVNIKLCHYVCVGLAVL